MTSSVRAVPRFAWYGAGCAVAVLACAIYWGGVGNGFVYDDVPQVVQNPWIREPWRLLRVFDTGSWAYQGTTSNYYRPVMHLVYAAAYALFGLDPAGFHAVSVVLHAVVSVLVLVATAIVLEDRGSARGRIALSTAAALLFAAHPIHTEAVSWIGGVPDLCAACFFLAAFCAYATAPLDRLVSWRYVISLACFLLAALSKEIALTLPAVLLAYDLGFRRGAMRSPRQFARYVGVAVVMVVYLALRWNALAGFAPVRRHPEIHGAAVLLNALPLFTAYLEKLAFPLDLTVFHAFHPIPSWGRVEVMAALVVTVLFVAGGVLLWTRRSGGGLVAWAFLLAPLLPALYIPAVGENPFAERYLYLPSVGFVWLLVLAARAVAATPRVSAGLGAVGALLVAAYAFGVVIRQPAWRSDLSLWQDASEKSPDAPIVHYNLGAALFADGRLERALAEFQAAIRLQPSPAALKALGTTYERLGRVDEAVRSYQAALFVDPTDAPARQRLTELGGREVVEDRGPGWRMP